MAIDYEGIGLALQVRRTARDASTAIVARDSLIISYQRRIEQLNAELKAERAKSADLLAQIVGSATQ